jgi:hypothetical protein
VVNLECLARGERLELWAAPEGLRERGLASRPSSASATRRHGYRSPEATTSRSPAACVIRWPYVEYHLPADEPRIAEEALLAPAVELASRLVDELLG